jgi:AraC-like DNA-binding protein
MNVELHKALTWLANADPYRTTDLDAARQHIGALFVPHRLDVTGCHQRLDVCIGCASVGGVSLVFHRHGASVRVRPEPLRTFFLLQIPIRGEAYIRLDQQELHCSPKQGIMISPNLGVDMRFGTGCEQLIVRIEKTDLERHLEAQLGRSVGAPLEFSPAVPLAAPGPQEIAALLRLMTASLIEGRGMCSSAFTRKHMVSLLLSGLLTCLDHNYRDELDGSVQMPRPAYLSRAQEFIRQNLREAIDPEDIAAAAHVSTRALHAAFKANLNTTPMRYLKQLRLDMVREALHTFDPRQASVTTIALEHGFQHLGHFCMAYKERFGELPRDTLYKKVTGASRPRGRSMNS